MMLGLPTELLKGSSWSPLQYGFGWWRCLSPTDKNQSLPLKFVLIQEVADGTGRGRDDDRQVQHFQKASEEHSCILNPGLGWEGQKVYQNSILHDDTCSPCFQVDILATSQLPLTTRPGCLPLLGTLPFALERNLGLRKGATVPFMFENTHTIECRYSDCCSEILLWFKPELASGFPPESSWCPVFEMLSSAGKT